MSYKTHQRYMSMAIEQAREAMEIREVPTGCVIVGFDGTAGEGAEPERARILGKAHNQMETLKDPTAHAEMIAITQASSAIGDWRLTDTVLYVTKEPCCMCAGAIIHARIPVVVFGTPDPQRGAVSVFNMLNHPSLNHRCEVISGIMQEECLALLRDFFKARRNGC